MVEEMVERLMINGEYGVRELGRLYRELDQRLPGGFDG
jgi:hypothetical protein